MYRTMSDVIRANKAIDHHFFDPGTLRWFGSRIGRTLYGGRYFVTSERDSGMTIQGQHYAAWDGRRRYTIREALPDGTIEDVGEVGEYTTGAQARAAIQRLVKGGTP